MFSRRKTLLSAGAVSLATLALTGTEAKAETVAGKTYNAVTDGGLVADARMRTVTNDRGWVLNPRDGKPIVEGTDNTAKLQALIDRVHQEGGGTIYLPAGKYKTGPIYLESNTNLEGEGRTTVLYLADQVNGRSLINNRLADSFRGNAFGFSVRNLEINGNRWGQTIDWYAKKPADTSNPHQGMSHGVLLHRIPIKGEHTDSRTIIDGVYATNFYHSGFHTKEHGGEVRLLNCYSFRNGGFGYTTGWDSFTIGCTAGQNGFDGFDIRHGSAVFVGCKSFMSGYTPSSHLIDGGFYPGRPSAGFHFQNIGHITAVGLNAQNNTGPGFKFTRVSGVNLSGLSDSNNMSAIDTDEAKWFVFSNDFETHNHQLKWEKENGVDSNLRKVTPWSFSGVEFHEGSHDNVVNVASWSCQRQNGTPMGHQRHAVQFSEDSYGNHVTVSHSHENGLKVRHAGEVLNPHNTGEQGRKNNFLQDSWGNILARQPDFLSELRGQIEELKKQVEELKSALTQKQSPTAPSLEIVKEADRPKYQEPFRQIIDAKSGAVLYFNPHRWRWINSGTGKAV